MQSFTEKKKGKKLLSYIRGYTLKDVFNNCCCKICIPYVFDRKQFFLYPLSAFRVQE